MFFNIKSAQRLADLIPGKLQADPWRPIVQQFIVGMPEFRRKLRAAPGEMQQREARYERPPGRDSRDGVTMAERFREQLPNAHVELVDDANHLVLIDRPDVVTEQLPKFLGAM